MALSRLAMFNLKIIKKGQSAFEFVMMICFVFFFFVLFYTVIAENISDKIKERNDLALKNLAMGVKNEIDLAYLAGEGYERTFIIGQKIEGLEYNITLISGMIYIKSKRSSLALPTPYVNGSLVFGKNIIKNKNNTIYLN